MEEQGKFFETKELEKMWPAMDFDQWRASGVKASRTQGKGDRYISDLNWFIGDWLLAGKEQVSKKRGGKKWGSMKEVRELAVLLWPKPWATLKNYMGIAKEFPKKSRRRDNLYWSHHAEVRKFSVEVQEKYLNECALGDGRILSVKGLRDKIHDDHKMEAEGWRRELWLKGAFDHKKDSDDDRGPGSICRDVKVTFNRENSEVLDRLYTTEKPVHGQKDVEHFVIWLMSNGMASVNWETDKGKEVAERCKTGLEKQALKKSQAREIRDFVHG